MRNIKKFIYLLSATVLLFMAGCVSLDENPMTFITPDKFFKTEADANAVCLGMYPEMYSVREMWTLLPRGVQANLRDGRMTAENILEPNAADNGNMTAFWTSLYRCIQRANTAIDGLMASPLEASKKNPYIAEAKAMRAYCYLRLAKNWGDVPLHTTTFDTEFGVAPMKQIYDLVFQDLNDAMYYHKIAATRSKPGRLDRGACRMLISDAALTIAQSAKSYKSGNADAAALKPYSDLYGSQINELFTLAQRQLDTLINKEGYALVNGTTEKWINMFGRTSTGIDNTNNKESIIRTMTIPTVYTSLPEQRSVPGNSLLYPAADDNVGFCSTYEYVASFNKDDIRRNEGFLWDCVRYYNENDVKIYHSVPFRQFGNEPYGALEGGLINPNTDPKADYPNTDAGGEWGGTDAEDQKKSITVDGKNMWIIARRNPDMNTPYSAKFYDASCLSGSSAISVTLYRISEAYLMYAEVEVALHGVTQVAVDHLNAIRVRAFTDDKKIANTFKVSDFSDINEFNKHLINEYLWEFACEFKDVYVMTRFGKFQERMEKVVDTYAPVFSASYTGSVLGVEAEARGQYANRARKARGVPQYWLPYPLAGEETNPGLSALGRMNYK